MTRLATHLDHYLTVRRGFGYDLSTSERVLRRFTAFADNEHADYITTALFLSWKNQFGEANNSTWSARLGIVRAFATWLQGIDPKHEVPPSGLIVGKLRRPRPFIYSKNQIAEMVTTASLLPSSYGLRGLTCSTLFGLIAATGLRISEAIGIDDRDVDLDKAVLTIQRGKNGKSRMIPISGSAVERLNAYQCERNRLNSHSLEPFFQSEKGIRPTDCGIRYNFAQVCQRIGLREPERFKKHGRGPRIHDLRHTFAVRTIINWYRRGLDPDREMIKLSTYLGHSNPEHTYWYIEAVPELLQLASERAAQSLNQREGR